MRQRLGKPAGDLNEKRLIEYAAPRLLALDAEMKDRRKNTYVGISSQRYTFDFNIFTRYEIDAIPASRSSTAMLMRKISDIFGVPDNDDRFEPTVIVDDMTDELTFKTEAKILSNEMNVIPASKIDRWKPAMILLRHINSGKEPLR